MEPKQSLRSCRGLGGWINKCPSRSRVPQPFSDVTAIAGQVVLHGRNDIAPFLLMACCARPNQLLPLQTQFLLKPAPASDHWSVLLNPIEEGVASKTNEYDISVALDHEWKGGSLPAAPNVD